MASVCCSIFTMFILVVFCKNVECGECSPSATRLMEMLHADQQMAVFSVEQLEGYCRTLKHLLNLYNEEALTTDCTDPVLTPAYNSFQEIVQQLCQDPVFKEELIQHTECLQREKEAIETCTQPMLDILSQSKTVNTRDERDYTVYKFCLSFRKARRCIYDDVELKCDLDAAQFVNNMTSKGAGFFIRNACNTYLQIFSGSGSSQPNCASIFHWFLWIATLSLFTIFYT